jgi:arylsulfatase A-like enzyme
MKTPVDNLQGRSILIVEKRRELASILKRRVARYGMRAYLCFILFVALIGLSGASSITRSQHPQAPTQGRFHDTRPNIVFILTDDMALTDMQVMSRVKTLIVDEGTSFANFFVTNSLCCPSRASILRGQYVHNHKVTRNAHGFQNFRDFGHESSTMATWLKAAGYTTALMGKYLNGYALKGQENYVPPGWDEWHSPVDNGAYTEFDYRMNENGKIVTYGKADNDYLTDVLARKAKVFIHQVGEKKSPFFLYLATYAPHQPAIPAPRHQNLYSDARAPKTPSFDEKDVSAKPAFVRERPLLSEKQLLFTESLYRKRLQSLRAVDEMVGEVVQALKETRQLHNTYIVFTSDNGFHLGQHRLPYGKQTAYEEDIHVPLAIRGPGIAANHVVSELGIETDLAPTFAEWAGAATPDFVDGRSLVPLLSHDAVPSRDWRQGVLIDHYPGTEPFMSRVERLLLSGKASLPAYSAVRSTRYLYVEYATGERELYNLHNDPAELTNIYKGADPALIHHMSAWLSRMKSCHGSVCRQSEASALEYEALSYQFLGRVKKES